MDDLVIFCADVGSVKAGRFGWARVGSDAGHVVEHDASKPADLVQAVVADLAAGWPVALGFECPLFVPVPEDQLSLGAARDGEGNRPWSAGAGTGAMATGLVQAAWVLRAVRAQTQRVRLHLDWHEFAAQSSGLLIWEAFVSASAKGPSHVDDATIAAEAFQQSLPDPTSHSTISATEPFSLIGAVALWSGWRDDPHALQEVPVVIRAA